MGVAAAVLLAAPCPVVLVPPARGRKRWALRQLLVPHDGTPTSAATIGPATDFASMAAAELVVLHVDALAPAALVERMKLSGEDVRGLVVERRPGAAGKPTARVVARRSEAALAGLTTSRDVSAPSPRGSRAPPASMKASSTPGTKRPTEPGTFVFPRYVDQPQHEWPVWAQEFLDRLRAVGGARDGVDIHLAVAHGEAGSAIVDFAQENDSDLIVLGWRGVLEPDRARTMRRVIHDSNCPVVVFRLDRDDDR